MSNQFNYPMFFHKYEDEVKSEANFEALQDFFLRWTFRCAKQDAVVGNNLLNEYSRRIVHALIYGTNNDWQYEIPATSPGLDGFAVKDMKVNRQENKIDLLVFITLVNGEKFLLNIENKFYTNTSASQLSNASNYVQRYAEEYQIVNLLIACDDERTNDYVPICKENNFKYCSIDQLRDLCLGNDAAKTGNDLFDAYWWWH